MAVLSAAAIMTGCTIDDKLFGIYALLTQHQGWVEEDGSCYFYSEDGYTKKQTPGRKRRNGFTWMKGSDLAVSQNR